MSEKTLPSTEQEELLPKLDTLLATLLYLMSRYSLSADANVQRSIVSHLGMLQRHPEAKSESYKNLGSRLKAYWQQHQKQTNTKPLAVKTQENTQNKRSVLH